MQHYDTRITFRLNGLEKGLIFEEARLQNISVTHLLRAIVEGYLRWLRKQRSGSIQVL
jgi:hypothetical protein